MQLTWLAALAACSACSACRGPLTFGTGVSLKLAVARLTAWAADCGVKEEPGLGAGGGGGGGGASTTAAPVAGGAAVAVARSTEMSDYRLFPCLRASADLLMMPKEVRRGGGEGAGGYVCVCGEAGAALRQLACFGLPFSGGV